ncbi:MAG: tetratricopeptide repeat protein [Polyangiales bacterium]
MIDPTDSLPIARSPLVGRMAEREAVADAVAAAVVHNRCEVVTLVGNPGVGKTRLVQELVADLAERFPDVRVYRGAARADVGVQAAIAQILRERFGLHEGTDAHAQANEVCAQVMDLFGDRRVDEILHFLGVFLGLRFGGTLLAEAFDADPRAYQHVARAVLRRLFEVDAQRGPIVLVFEDIHLAGPDGLRTLRELTDSLRRAPVVVVYTARPELFARMHDFCDAPAGRHRRVDLALLDRGESTVLARMLLSTIESCPEELIQKAVELGGGNPLLIEQIVRVYFDQGVIQVDGEGMATIDLDRLERITLPQSMEEAVRARLSALSPSEREMLERAALMGPTFWLGGLVVLGRTHEPPPKLWGGAEDLALHYRDLLKGLVDRGYVERRPRSVIPGDEEYAFKRPAEREELAALIAPEDATALHLVLAEWLEFRFVERNEEQLDLLARHYERGERPLRAARCYLSSAESARARWANEKSVAHYKRGLELLGEHDIALRLDAHHHAGEVLALLGRNDDALVHFHAMLSLAWRLDLKSKGGAAHNRIGRVHRDIGSLDECMRHLGTALALFEAAGDERGVAASYDDIGKTHWLRGNYEMAQRFLQDALERREAQGDKRSIALSLNNLGLVYQDSGQYRAAHDAFIRARDLRREVSDLQGLVVTLNNLGTIYSDRGDSAEAIALWSDALEIAREIGDRRRQAVLLLNVGEAHYHLRNAAESLRILTEVEGLCASLGDKLLLSEARRGLGKAHFLNGDIGLALTHLEAALELAEQLRSRVHVGVARRSLAEVLSVHGLETAEGQRASTLLRQALELFEDLGAEIEVARTARTYAEHLASTPEAQLTDEARAEIDRLRARADALYAKLYKDTRDFSSREMPSRKPSPATNPGLQRAERASSLGLDPYAVDADPTPPEGYAAQGEA